MGKSLLLWSCRILAYISWGISIISFLSLYITTIIGSSMANLLFLFGAFFYHLGVLLYYVNIGNLILLISFGYKHKREKFFKVNLFLIVALIVLKPILPYKMLFNKISEIYGL